MNQYGAPTAKQIGFATDDTAYLAAVYARAVSACTNTASAITTDGPLWGRDLATAAGTDTALTDAENDEQTLTALIDRATDGDDPLEPRASTRHGALGVTVIYAITAGADLGGGVATATDLWLVVDFVTGAGLGAHEVEPRVYAWARAARTDHAARVKAIRAAIAAARTSTECQRVMDDVAAQDH